ncbi:MAG: DEAD/DEAH box helicase [Deltaproteobacteria bacterium]|nr:DEAD/DEAH box helicase [Deltaproteobacteria bacterium]
MRFQFDPHLLHQRRALEVVLELLEGARGVPDDATLLGRLQDVQRSEGLPISKTLEGHEFTLDMETGTGKTYVYLRTLHELHVRHGLSRAVIVVPSVAIREGVLQQIRATREHFAELYAGQEIQASLYDPSRLSDLKRFARDPGLQVLVLNMDAFNKGWSNLIHRPTDGLDGTRPSALIAEARPIVILDEPQNLEGPSTRTAIEDLSASLTLRYSATHRRRPNLLYRLDPVRAYDLRLVKRIEVIGVTPTGSEEALIDVLEVKGHRTGVRAKVMIDALVDGEIERKELRVRGEGEDLFQLSGEREIYRGWAISALDADRESVHFANGEERRVGGVEASNPRLAIMARQVEETLREHLELELRLARLRPAGQAIKVLSLFFIERVAHYAPDRAPLREIFERTYERLSAEPRYDSLDLPSAQAAHAGYFAQRRGEAINTRGRSREDQEAYELIMRDKARLLDRAEPVRFIFSHSALREGWDNPNVFQICTLHPTRSEFRKRQEIGRGLRLPVDERGARVSDPDITRLVVIANERYETFARQLQREYREDHGRDLGARVVDRRAPRPMRLREGWRGDGALLRLWERVGRRVPFILAADTPTLVQEGAAALEGLGAGTHVKLRVERIGEGRSEREEVLTRLDAADGFLGDPVVQLQRETELKRSTLVAMLRESGCSSESLRSSESVSSMASRLRMVVRGHLCERVTYAPDRAVDVPMSRLEDRPLRSAGRRVQPMRRSVHEAVPAASDDEARWLRRLDEHPGTEIVLRWPPWLAVATPAGEARPSWAILADDEVTIVGDGGSEAEPRQRALRSWCASIEARWCSGFDRHEA